MKRNVCICDKSAAVQKTVEEVAHVCVTWLVHTSDVALFFKDKIYLRMEKSPS